MSPPKVIITGTGRAGTTLLVLLLTDLGVDTGFRPGMQADLHSGGLERNVERSPARVVKAPGLSTRLRGLLEAGTIEVEHVVVPVRELEVAAASRVRVAGYGRHLGVRGGFTGTRSARRQGDVLARMLYELVYTITLYDLPHTFLAFPRFTHDWEYAHSKLGWLAPDKTPDDFRRALEARYDPAEIREEPLTRSERVTAALRRPAAVARDAVARLRSAERDRGRA